MFSDQNQLFNFLQVRPKISHYGQAVYGKK